MFTIFGNQYEAREEYLLLSIFQNILAAEFESATNFAGLIRANTPVSRMMTTYTRYSVIPFLNIDCCIGGALDKRI